jgi:hypothetical protein
MGASELTGCGRAQVHRVDARDDPRVVAHTRTVLTAYVALWVITLAGATVGAALPGLASSGRPHPTLTGSFADFVAVATTNARVLSAPFLLAVCGFPVGRRSRQLGDLIVGGLLAGNAARVGLELGRWRAQLVPYVPQLPLEWLAAAIAGAAWMSLRTGARRRTALTYLAALLVLVIGAAAVETATTPHASTYKLNTSGSQAGTPLHSPVPTRARKAGGGLPALRSCAGAGARFKVASLPSPRYRSVPLGRLASAPGLRQPPPDPAKEGPQ